MPFARKGFLSKNLVLGQKWATGSGGSGVHPSFYKNKETESLRKEETGKEAPTAEAETGAQAQTSSEHRASPPAAQGGGGPAFSALRVLERNLAKPTQTKAATQELRQTNCKG